MSGLSPDRGSPDSEAASPKWGALNGLEEAPGGLERGEPNATRQAHRGWARISAGRGSGRRRTLPLLAHRKHELEARLRGAGLLQFSPPHIGSVVMTTKILVPSPRRDSIAMSPPKAATLSRIN